MKRWAVILLTLLAMMAFLVPTAQAAGEKITGRVIAHFTKTETMEVGDVPVNVWWTDECLMCEGGVFGMTLPLFGRIAVQATNWERKGSVICVSLCKVAPGFWKQLVRAEEADNFKARLKVDWELWLDENGDDEDDDESTGLKKIDFSDLPSSSRVAADEEEAQSDSESVDGFETAGDANAEDPKAACEDSSNPPMKDQGS
jgi:hypothetical protein